MVWLWLAKVIGDLIAGAEAQFLQDVCDVVLGRTLRDVQPGGDPGVAKAAGDQRGNFSLTAGENDWWAAVMRRPVGR